MSAAEASSLLIKQAISAKQKLKQGELKLKLAEQELKFTYALKRHKLKLEAND